MGGLVSMKMDENQPPLIPPRQPRRRIEGMGDVVALGAKPIARAIDRMLGTDLTNCQECEERRKEWNAAVPFKNDLDVSSGEK